MVADYERSGRLTSGHSRRAPYGADPTLNRDPDRRALPPAAATRLCFRRPEPVVEKGRPLNPSAFGRTFVDLASTTARPERTR